MSNKSQSTQLTTSSVSLIILGAFLGASGLLGLKIFEVSRKQSSRKTIEMGLKTNITKLQQAYHPVKNNYETTEK